MSARQYTIGILIEKSTSVGFNLLFGRDGNMKLQSKTRAWHHCQSHNDSSKTVQSPKILESSRNERLIPSTASVSNPFLDRRRSERGDISGQQLTDRPVHT